MKVQENALGFIIETSSIIIFFGKKEAQLEKIQQFFSSYQFTLVHQTHGRKIQLKDSTNWTERPEADAQWTEQKKLGLCISTADCIPAFVYDLKKARIAGVHAVWKGVANRIVPQTLELFLNTGSKPQDLRLVLGPHIQKQSFEVDLDVKNQLIAVAKNLSNSNTVMMDSEVFTQNTEGKFQVDLSKIVKSQAQEHEVSLDHFFDLNLDTKSDHRFHSHRRDKEKAGRQLSFILQK